MRGDPQKAVIFKTSLSANHRHRERFLDYLWQLVNCIADKQEISIDYYRIDRKWVTHRLRPASVMFTDYYFYLIAKENPSLPSWTFLAKKIRGKYAISKRIKSSCFLSKSVISTRTRKEKSHPFWDDFYLFYACKASLPVSPVFKLNTGGLSVFSTGKYCLKSWDSCLTISAQTQAFFRVFYAFNLLQSVEKCFWC